VKFPSVKKAFSRIAPAERISSETVQAVGAALLTAGLVAANAPISQADIAMPTIQAAQPGGVIVIPMAPSISLSDGTTIIADHFSHSSHASHASHCSGYSYCN